MRFSTKKSLLAISISMALSTSLLTACGGSGSDNTHNNGGESSHTGQQQEQTTLNVKAYAKAAKFEPIEVAHWQAKPVLPTEPDKFDEQVISMDIQNGEVVAITRWHNSIIKFADKSTNTAINPEPFSTLLTAEHHVKSDDNDIVSGASEHLLQDVEYTSDNKFMYALVRKPKRSAPADDDTYGLFKVGLNADGSIPTQQVNGNVIAHRGDNVQRVSDANITDILRLDNNDLLAMDEDNNAIRYYDSHFALQESKSIALTDNQELELWTADKETLYLLLEVKEGDKEQYVLEKRLLSNPQAVVKTVSFAKSTDIQKIKSNAQQLVVITEQAVQLFDNNLTKLTEVTVNAGIEQASISTDFKRVAVLDKNESLSLVDIDGKTLSTPITVNLDKVDSFGDFALADANSLFYNSDRGKISKLDLNQPMDTLSDKQVIEQSLANIKDTFINHGYPANAVRYDLNLPSKNANLPINYSWQSSNTSVISNQGVVTTPSNGVPVKVTLTATGRTEDGKVTAQRQFELTVLPQSVVLDNGTETALNDILPKERFNYNHKQYSNNTANADGSLYALFKDDGLSILQKQSDNSLKAVTAGDKKLIMPKLQPGQLSLEDPEMISVMWQGIDTLWIVLSDKNKGALVKKTFTNSDDLAQLTKQASDEWQVVKTYDFPVVAGFVNDNKTHLSVVTDKGNDDNINNGYQVTTYDVTTAQNIADYTIDRDLSRDYVTIDNSGRYVFVTTRNKATGGGEFYRYVDGKLDSEFEVDEPYHSGVVTDDGNFIGSGRYGHLLFVKNATGNTPIVLTATKKHSFARENYDGTNYLIEKDHHNGRIYSVARAGTQLFVGYYGIGVSVVDISNFETPVETQFVPYADKQYLVLPSSDANYLLQAGDRDGMFKVSKLK